jgi:tetrahydromethanopterin S-methyltransferase subunit G
MPPPPRKPYDDDDDEDTRRAMIAHATRRQDERLDDVRKTLEKLDERFEKLDARFERYITRDAFRPVEMLVYGVAGALLLALVGAIVNLVIHK